MENPSRKKTQRARGGLNTGNGEFAERDEAWMEIDQYLQLQAEDDTGLHGLGGLSISHQFGPESSLTLGKILLNLVSISRCLYPAHVPAENRHPL